MRLAFFHLGAAGWRWLLSAILALALVVRFVALDVAPPGLWYDEALYCMSALSIGVDGNYPIFFMTEAHPHEPLFVYSLAAWFKLFGVSIVSARSCSAVWGTLAVAVMWPLAVHVLRSRSWALVAVFVMAVMRWPVHFSRTIFRAGLSALFIALAVWLFLRWRERRRVGDAILCGGALGIGCYTYLSFRLVPLIFGVWIAWQLWRGLLSLRRDGTHLAIMAATALAVFAPLGIDWAVHPDHFSGRTDEVSMFMERTTDGAAVAPKPTAKVMADMARNAVAVAGVWFVRGDHVGKHNLPYEPIFDPVSGALFIVGLLWCLRNVLRNEFAFLLLIWLAALSATSVFSFGAPNILRMQGAIPAVVLILVLGLRTVWRMAGKRGITMQKRNAWATGFLALFAVYQLYTYVLFAIHPDVRREFLADSFVAPAKKVRELLHTNAAKTVYVPEELAGHTVFRLITWEQRDSIVPYLPDTDLPTTAPAALFIATRRSMELSSPDQRTAIGKMRQVSGWTIPITDETGTLSRLPFGYVLRP